MSYFQKVLCDYLCDLCDLCAELCALYETSATSAEEVLSLKLV